MRKPILLLATLFMAMNSFSQDSKFSATLSYPLTVGDNFLNEYTGYVDVGVQYRFLDLNVVQLGVSANVGFIGIPNPENEGEKFSGMLIHPKIFGEFPLGPNGEFKPMLGIGYGANRFKTTTNSDGISLFTSKRTFEGIVLNVGASYDITEQVFAIAQFDWADIDRSTLTVGNEKYNTTGNIIRIGVGYRF